jgi:hypothetical protein
MYSSLQHGRPSEILPGRRPLVMPERAIRLLLVPTAVAGEGHWAQVDRREAL